MPNRKPSLVGVILIPIFVLAAAAGIIVAVIWSLDSIISPEEITAERTNFMVAVLGIFVGLISPALVPLVKWLVQALLQREDRREVEVQQPSVERELVHAFAEPEEAVAEAGIGDTRARPVARAHDERSAAPGTVRTDNPVTRRILNEQRARGASAVSSRAVRSNVSLSLGRAVGFDPSDAIGDQERKHAERVRAFLVATAAVLIAVLLGALAQSLAYAVRGSSTGDVPYPILFAQSITTIGLIAVLMPCVCWRFVRAGVGATYFSVFCVGYGVPFLIGLAYIVQWPPENYLLILKADEAMPRLHVIPGWYTPTVPEWIFATRIFVYPMASAISVTLGFVLPKFLFSRSD